MALSLVALISNVIFLCGLNVILISADSGNSNVIVLVHGFLGWGPTEMLGFNYWGGVNNITKELRAAGHDVRTAVVGPVSSNWDRAVELYTYIKGGKVDYGAVHAAQFNHSRYGPTFPGIYPEWGTRGKDGSLRRVHFVGHSMGGQTVRVLLRLLAKGDPYEQQQSGASSLFEGGRGSWVHSISTLNTPHDGTTVCGKAVGVPFLDGFAWPLFKGICAIEDLFSDALPYDFKLGQFGLERRPGEGFFSYADRVKSSPIWNPGFRDFSSYDLSVSGAREMNAITPAEENVYYFSYAAVDTRKTWNPFSKHQVPRATMWLFLQPMSSLIGKTGDPSLWPNDGVVNTISHTGPKIGSKDVIMTVSNDTQTFRPGVWNYMGARQGVDHIENVGIGVQPVKSYYIDIAARIASLPDTLSISSMAEFAESRVLV